MSGKHHQLPWWRRWGRRPQPTKQRLLVSEMVEGATGVAPWVTREAFEQGLREATGCYVVLCGRRIAVASMVTPPQRCCRGCQEARAC